MSLPAPPRPWEIFRDIGEVKNVLFRSVAREKIGGESKVSMTQMKARKVQCTRGRKISALVIGTMCIYLVWQNRRAQEIKIRQKKERERDRKIIAELSSRGGRSSLGHSQALRGFFFSSRSRQPNSSRFTKLLVAIVSRLQLFFVGDKDKELISERPLVGCLLLLYYITTT